MLHNFKHKVGVIVLTILMSSSFFHSNFASAQTNEFVVKAGTPIEATTTYEINSGKNPQGSPIELRTVNPIMVKGVVVIPAGAIIKGRVTQCKKHAIFGGSGNITIEANSVMAVDGTPIPISGLSMSNEGKSRVGWAIITGVSCLPLVGFLIPGQQGKIPAGSQLSGYVMSNTAITIDDSDE